MTEPAEWRWDDEQLQRDDVLYRRVPNKPDYFSTQERFTGAVCFHPVAFNLSDYDYDAPESDIDRVADLDPPPSDFEDVRERLDWGKARAKRGFRGWEERQAGLSYEHAGCSVQIDSLMQIHELETAALADWGNEVVGLFRVGDVRDSGGGVIACEDPTDDELGRAHGLIRTVSPNMKPPSAYAALRSKLLERVVYVDRDPAQLGELSRDLSDGE